MTPEEKSLCLKEGCRPEAVERVAMALCCTIDDAIPRFKAKKKAEKNIQYLLAEESRLRKEVKELQEIQTKPQTTDDLRKMNRNLSVQNDILFNIYGRVMECIETRGMTDEDRVDKIKQLVTNSLIAVTEVGMTNPAAIGGDDENTNN